jgi:Zn-dependent protease
MKGNNYMKCQKCQTETLMPFQCKYCGGQFCSEHRLPENHDCPQIAQAQTQKREAVNENVAPQTNSYQYSVSWGGQPFQKKRKIFFSPKELTHILVAAFLVAGIGISIGLYNNYFGGFNFTWTWDLMAVFAVIMVVSFLTHEIAHKVFAQKAGMWAEFRLTTWGAVLTLVSVFLPFKMISPGAMMIGGSIPSAKDMIKISVGGVITNLIYAGLFLGLAFVLPLNLPYYASMLLFAAYINAFMAVFNMIPFGILDGYKLFNLNKKIWAATFIPSAILAIGTYLLLFGF